MATVTPTFTPNNALAAGPGATLLASWALTSANSDGRGVPVAGFDKLNWQGVAGTPGGATLAFEASNDGGTTWYPLTKVGGSTAATLTASGGAETNEHPVMVRPNLTTVGTNAVWTVYLFASK